MTEISQNELNTLKKLIDSLTGALFITFQIKGYYIPRERIITGILMDHKDKYSNNFRKMFNILINKLLNDKVKTQEDLFKRINKMQKLKNERHNFVADLTISQIVANRIIKQ